MKTVLLVLLCPTLLWAQTWHITPEDTQRRHSYLLMRDGSIVRGQILRQDSTVITVQKRNGDKTFVEADQLVHISAVAPTASNPAATDYPPAAYPVFVLKDGSRVEGKFVRRDSTMITVRKRNGQLTYFEPELLVRTDTVRADAVPGAATARMSNRFSPWLLTGLTAYTPEKGRLYYRNTVLLLNSFNYGLTRHWSIGASINPFLNDLKQTNTARELALGATVRVSSKLTFPIGNQFRFGVNAVYQPRQRLNFYSFSGQWTFQGLMSLGDSQRNVTLGYGLRLYEGTGRYRTPSITAGVMHKISRSLTFISDNTFYLNPYFSDASTYLSAALRIDRPRHAFDLGILAAIYPYRYTANTDAVFTPYVGYNLLIGRP